MAYFLDPYSVLLGSEGEIHERCVLEIGLCGGFRKKAEAEAECKIFEAERFSVIIESGVLSRDEKEEVCDYNNVTFSLEEGVDQRSGNA